MFPFPAGRSGPIAFKGKFAQGDVVFQQSRSLLFKKVQIVRGCDEKRNVLVYLIYSDKLVEGSPKNSTSSVPLMPWGAAGRSAEMRRLAEEMSHRDRHATLNVDSLRHLASGRAFAGNGC